MLLIAFIATNVVWAGLYFAMWFYYEKRDVKTLTELLGVYERLKSANEKLKDNEEVLREATVMIRSLCDRCEEWKAYVNTLTGKRVEA